MTPEYLRKVLDYDPATGVFTWKVSMGKKVKVGQRVGCFSHHRGYTFITIKGKTYLAHRLAWLYMTGEWPKNQIDHINRTPGDDRWENLREFTARQNKLNAGVRKGKKIPVRGVKKYYRRYSAALAGKYLGTFATIEEAAAAWKNEYKLETGDDYRE